MAEAKTTLSDSAEEEVIKLSEGLEEKLVSAICMDWESAAASRLSWLKDKEEGLNLYWGIRSKKDFPFPNCANLHVPLIRTISDTLHSNVMGSIDTNKPASITPIGPEDVPKARKIEKLLNWQFSTQVNYADLVDRASLATLMYGIAPIKVRYVVEKKGSTKIYDGLKVEVLQPERFLYPPDAISSDVNEMDYVIHEIPLSKSDLMKRMNAGMYKKMSSDDLTKMTDSYNKAAREEEDLLANVRDLYSGMEGTKEHNKSRSYATVLEWYGYFDVNDDGVDESICVSLLQGPKKVLRAVRWNRSRPFVIMKFSEILYKVPGESVPDLLKNLNMELNTLRNQAVDSTTVANIPFFFFDPVAGFNPNDVKLTPGLGIPTNGPPSQAVYFPNMQPQRPEVFQEQQQIFEYAERMLGAGANVQGILQTKRVTATEVATVDRRSGIRFLTIFNRIRKALQEVFQLALEYDKEKMPREVQVRITGLDASAPVFDTVSKEDLSAKVDITVNGNSVLDEQAEQTEQMRAYQIGMSNPLVVRDEMAMYELTRDLFVKLGVKRIDAYLRRPTNVLPKEPNEEHNLFMQEEYVEPHVQEDAEAHLRAHAELINSDKFKLLSKKGQINLLKHYSATERMKSLLEQMRIVQKMEQINNMMIAAQSGAMPPGAQMPPDGQMMPNGQGDMNGSKARSPGMVG